MIAALLIRCSTNRQDYERQINDLTKVAKDFNFIINKEYIFGEYVTGKDDVTKGDRYSIRKLKESAVNKAFDVILINEVNRLSRDSVSGRVYIRQLNNLGIPVYFRDKRKWTIDLTTKKVDEAFEKELGLYFDGAAEYLKSMKTQTASGRRNRLSDNQMIQGKPAFGYKKLGGNNKYTRNTVIIDETKAEIVQYIYLKYLEEGATLKSTALATSAKYNMTFSVGKINHILNYDGYYNGKTTVTTVDPDDKEKKEIFTITFDPILKEEQFHTAQAKLKKNRNSRVPYNKQQMVKPLTRLIKCSFCGHSYTPRKRQGREAFAWICMSRINNSNPECKSEINLNNEKVEVIIWELIKQEMLLPTKHNQEEKIRRIKKEQDNISSWEEEITLLDTQKATYKKKNDRAYKAYLNAVDDDEQTALDHYNETLQESKENLTYIDGKIKSLKAQILESNAKIERYIQKDFSEEYIKAIEQDSEKKRQIFLDSIKTIHPYKVDYRVIVLEVDTVEGIYYVLLDGNQRKHPIATYIHNSFATWQNSLKRIQAYPAGDYFVIQHPDMLMDSDELEEFVTFKEMDKICRENNWEIDYSNYVGNLFIEGYVSRIEKYNEQKRNGLINNDK